jgi:hypothetical protein
VAVTAAATVVVVLVVVIVTAAAVIVVATTSAAVAMTSAATCQVFHHVVNFFLGGLAVLQYSTLEVERLASQWVVEVHLHFLFANLQHATIEALTLVVLQRNNGVVVDMFVVKVPDDADHVAIEV